MSINPKTGLYEKLIEVNRVTKVVKGGRILRFSALVVVGDGAGKVALGKGKAREVALAVQKAMEKARSHMRSVNLLGGTVYHVAQGRFGACRVYVQPADEGTGIISGGATRSVFEAAGISNVLSKNIGSTNPHSVVRAALDALLLQRTPEDVASKRQMPVAEITQRHRSAFVRFSEAATEDSTQEQEEVASASS